MKSILFTLVFTVGCLLTGYSQICTSFTDPQSGQTAKIGVVQLAGNISNKGTAITFISMKDSTVFNYTFYSNKTPDNFFAPKMYCLITFKDGSTKKMLSSQQTIIAKKDEGTLIGFMSFMNNDDIQQFHTKPISTITFCSNGDESEVEVMGIREDKVPLIMKATDCIKSK